jgi:hypothetical protein
MVGLKAVVGAGVVAGCVAFTAPTSFAGAKVAHASAAASQVHIAAHSLAGDAKTAVFSVARVEKRRAMVLIVRVSFELAVLILRLCIARRSCGYRSP